MECQFLLIVGIHCPVSILKICYFCYNKVVYHVLLNFLSTFLLWSMLQISRLWSRRCFRYESPKILQNLPFSVVPREKMAKSSVWKPKFRPLKIAKYVEKYLLCLIFYFKPQLCAQWCDQLLKKEFTSTKTGHRRCCSRIRGRGAVEAATPALSPERT